MDSIVFSGFTKKYGNFTAVDNISLTVEKGLITGFVGKNGAGKSTTLRTLVNVIFPTSGTVTVNGLDSVRDAKAIKRFISYMSSDSAFYDGVTSADIFHITGKFLGAAFETAAELAEYFELDINKKVSQLSLGNRKKVSIIQALMKDSEILVMDEPTNGLDPLMQEKFFEKVLERKNQGATVFLSSHNLGELEKYCDKAVIIKDGKIAEEIDMKIARQNRKQMVVYETQEGITKEYTYDGDINELVVKLSGLKLKSLEIRPASIEEEFIKYYSGEEKESEINE